MQEPDFYIDIFLNPGDFYFGDKETRIRTILGSCISITMWHPTLLIGGMCHYVVPKRPYKKPTDPLDGRYANEAMEMFLREIRAAGTHPSEYQVKVFGGGKMFNASNNNCNCSAPHGPIEKSLICRSVSCRNVATAQVMIDQLNLEIKGACMGGTGHRKLFFDVWSGQVWSKLTPVSDK